MELFQRNLYKEQVADFFFLCLVSLKSTGVAQNIKSQMYCDNLHTAAVKLYVYDKQLITMHEVITAMYTVSCKTWNVEWNGTWNGMWNGTWNGT